MFKLNCVFSVIRHPEFRGGPWYWSHHEKIVVVDQRIALIGGIDLAFGRYDTQDHQLCDPNGLIWIGKDYYNPCITPLQVINWFIKIQCQ